MTPFPFYPVPAILNGISMTQANHLDPKWLAAICEWNLDFKIDWSSLTNSIYPVILNFPNVSPLPRSNTIPVTHSYTSCYQFHSSQTTL